VIAPGFAFASESGVTVTAQQESTGHALTLSAAEVGSAAGTVTLGTTLSESVLVRLRWNGFVVATMGIDATTGAYAFEGVPVGTYTVEATDGTTTVSSDATVTAGATTDVAPLALP
jgi:hypothetical protein